MIREWLAQIRAALTGRPLEIEFPESDEPAQPYLAPVTRHPATPADDEDDVPAWERELLERGLAEDVDTFRVLAEDRRKADAETWERIRRGEALLRETAAEITEARGRRTARPRKSYRPFPDSRSHDC